MLHELLAQNAITLPSGSGNDGPPIPYPSEFQGFKFAGASANIGAIISSAILYIFAFAGIALLLMFLFAGFEYLTSAGDAKKLEQGRQRLTYAIVGFLIIFSAFWIVQIAGKIFGIPEIGTIFK